MQKVFFPVESDKCFELNQVFDIHGKIFCGRDAVLPRIVECYHNGTLSDLGIDLAGSVIFHTAEIGRAHV